MSVTSSMYVGISGLSAQSAAASVISNNLANADTVGFKSSDTTFEDVFYSTISAGGSADQVGNGVAVASVDADFTQGSYESSSSATDLTIGGDGFFVVVDPDTGDTYYTRSGNFDLDVEGYLTDSHDNVVQGWTMEDGSISGTLGEILIEQNQSPPQATTEVSFSLNLNSDGTDNTTASNASTALFNAYDGLNSPPLADSRYEYSTSITVYDANGSSHDLTIAFDQAGTTTDGDMIWEYVVYGDADEDLREAGGTDVGTTSAAGLLMTGTMTFDASGQLESMTAFTLAETLANPTDLLDESNWVLAGFDGDGLIEVAANFTGGDDQLISLDLGLSNTDASTGTGWDTSSGIDSLDDITAATDLADLPSFNATLLSGDATTSYSSSSVTNSLRQDGYASGTLQDLIVNENGVISGQYSNGQTIELYTIALADFTNPNGLYSEGSNLYSATMDSGQAVIGMAGTGGFGDITSYSLEGSNVDIATEMTKLVILQAVYQANSKTITTANTLLETAISLKR